MVTVKPQTSIHDRIKGEGYDEGRKDEYDHQSQISQCRYDEVYEHGVRDGENDHPKRRTWFFFGIAVGAVIQALVYFYIIKP